MYNSDSISVCPSLSTHFNPAIILVIHVKVFSISVACTHFLPKLTTSPSCITITVDHQGEGYRCQSQSGAGKAWEPCKPEAGAGRSGAQRAVCAIEFGTTVRGEGKDSYQGGVLGLELGFDDLKRER